MPVLELDGTRICNEADLHRALSQLLDFGPYYGHNLDALWDRLSRDVERPVHLVWRHAADSRNALGNELFERILWILNRAVEEDLECDLHDKFTYELA